MTNIKDMGLEKTFPIHSVGPSTSGKSHYTKDIFKDQIFGTSSGRPENRMEKIQDRVDAILGMMLESGVIEDHGRELTKDLLRVLYQQAYEDGHSSLGE